MEYAEQVRKDKELHDIIQADKTEARHKENIDFCTRVTWQLIDFALKIGEYRELTEKYSFQDVYCLNDYSFH